MVLVPVGEHDRVDALPLEVGDVGQDEVDAQMLVAREGETRVHDDDVAAVLVDGHVLADFAETAERDDAQAHARECMRARGPSG